MYHGLHGGLYGTIVTKGPQMLQSADDFRMTAPENHPHHTAPFLERNHAWSLFSLALVLRLAVFFFILLRFGDAGFILPPFSDGHGYVAIANNVLAGNGFSRDEVAPFTPDTKRVPLYPLFLSLTFALSGGAWWLAALLQTVMSSALVLLVYKITDAVAGRRAAFFAGILAALHPFAIFLSTQLLAETFFTLILFGAFVFVMRTLTHPAYRAVSIGGVLMGLAALVKPAAQYIPFLILPFIALRLKTVQRLMYPIVFIACFAIAIAPWVTRNYVASGVPTLSYEANILFDLHIAGYTAFKETGAAANADKYRTVQNEQELLATGRGELAGRVLILAASDPITFTRYLLISTVPFVFGDGFVTMVTALSPNSTVPAWNFSTSASALGSTIGFGVLPTWLVLLSLFSKALWAFVLLGAVIGGARLIYNGAAQRLIAFSFILVIAYFMFAGGPVQSARYRMPVEPLIFLMAGVGVSEMVRLLETHRRSRRTLPPQSN